MILCLGPTPAAQRLMRFRRFVLDSVNRAVETLDGPAGKAVNVAKVLHTLGDPPLLTGFLGGDTGQRLQRDLERRGLAQQWVMVTPSTRQCLTVVDESTGAVTELVEESRPVEPEAYQRLWEIVQTSLPKCRALVIAGTLTPAAPPDFYARCLAFAHELGKLTLLDTQGAALWAGLAGRPAIIKPNRQELAAAVGRALTTEAAVLETMRELQQRGAGAVVVTAGPHATLILDGPRAWRLQPPQVQAVNPIGSGDAFTAAMTARLLRGDSLAEACRWGAAAGAANALTLMAGEVDPDTVRRLVDAVMVSPLEEAAA